MSMKEGAAALRVRAFSTNRKLMKVWDVDLIDKVSSDGLDWNQKRVTLETLQSSAQTRGVRVYWRCHCFSTHEKVLIFRQGQSTNKFNSSQSTISLIQV